MRKFRKHIAALLTLIVALGTFILCERMGLLDVGCDSAALQQVELFGIGVAFCLGVALFARAVWLFVTDLIFDNNEPFSDTDWMSM